MLSLTRIADVGGRCQDRRMPKTGRAIRDDSLTTAKPRTQGPLVLVAALVTVVLWASAFIGIRGAGPHFDPGALALLRMAVGTAMIAIIAVPTAMRSSASAPGSKCGPAPRMPMNADAHSTTVTRAATSTSGPWVRGFAVVRLSSRIARPVFGILRSWHRPPTSAMRVSDSIRCFSASPPSSPPAPRGRDPPAATRCRSAARRVGERPSIGWSRPKRASSSAGANPAKARGIPTVSYTHLRAHET